MMKISEKANGIAALRGRKPEANNGKKLMDSNFIRVFRV
jgi:hypothetical protein